MLFRITPLRPWQSLQSLFHWRFVATLGTETVQHLGHGWGNLLLGFIALAMTPMPWILYTKVGAIRRRARKT